MCRTKFQSILYRAPQKMGPRLCEYAVENCVPCTDCTQENFTFYFLFIQSQLKYCYLLSMLAPYMCGIKHNDKVQSGEMERNPDMDELAVWAGKGCMAVFPISRLRFISPPCIILLVHSGRATWIVLLIPMFSSQLFHSTSLPQSASHQLFYSISERINLFSTLPLLNIWPISYPLIAFM